MRFIEDPEYTRNVLARGVAGVRAVIGDLLLRRALGHTTPSMGTAKLATLTARVSDMLAEDGCHDVPEIRCSDGAVELRLECVEGRRTFRFAGLDEGEPHPSLIVAMVDRTHYERLRLTGRDQARWAVHPAMIVMARALRIPLLYEYRGAYRSHEYDSFERQGCIWRAGSGEVHERPRSLETHFYVKNETQAGTIMSVGTSMEGFHMVVQGMPQTILDQLPGKQLSDVVGDQGYDGDLRIARVDFNERTGRSTIVVTPRAYIPVPPDLVEHHD